MYFQKKALSLQHVSLNTREMKIVGLVHGLTTKLDALHTQSKKYVVEELQQALHRLEAQQNH